MNNRIGILITGGAAVVVLILLATLVAWGLRANGSASTVDGLDRETGSPFAPRVVSDASAGYVIAELYQDVGLDVRSGAYDQDGALLDRYWSHDADTQTCSLDLVLADQHGRDEIAPTATPRPPEPTATRLMAVMPPAFTSDGTPVATPYVFVPTPTPMPTPTTTPQPTPTATPQPTPLVTAATGWNHWKGRPLAIETDGVAILDLPGDVYVSAYLSVRTGADSGHNTHTELARLPLPEPYWEMGSAYVALAQASGRILLNSDDINATYRAAVLHLDISPLSDCAGLRLRWQRSAAVVVRALTDQPFADWVGRAAPPRTPMPANVAIYAAVRQDLVSMPSMSRFVPDDFLGNNCNDPNDPNDCDAPASTSTVAGHIVIPAAPDPAEDYYVGFAVRESLIPSGLSDIRQTGSPFNAYAAFDGSPGGIPINISGESFLLYQSEQRWRGSLLGGEWSLTP